MQVGLIIVGCILGAMLGGFGSPLFGLIVGGLLGYLVTQNHTLAKQLEVLRKEITHAAFPPANVVADHANKPEDLSPKSVAEEVAQEIADDAAPEQSAGTTQKPLEVPAVEINLVAHTPVQATPHKSNTFDRLFILAKEWITTGNVPVKVGVIISFFGVAFLLKYAVERKIFSLPIELRYLAVAAIAIALMTVGWRLRDRMRVYALSLQGGGIGILFLIIFAAFRLHPLLPGPLAFFLLVVLTAFAGILAVMQDAKALAILGIVGGFLAPVLTSTGSGNHIALFSYYLLLNCAVLGIAWFKTWRGLNIIGFIFTFGVGSLWGYESYRPGLFATTEPFLIIYFLFYQAIAVLFAYRQPPNLRGLVDGTLVFGTPVIAFALQSRLVDGMENGLSVSAITVAIFYILVAAGLHRRQGSSMRLLVESYVALAIAFATIAIPLALDDRWTAAAWSLEGAALIWVGVRQQGSLARLSGAVLLIAGGIAYIKYGWTHGEGIPIINGNFIGGMLISVASIFSARYLATDRSPMTGQQFMSVPLLLWGLAWWGAIGTWEIFERTTNDNAVHFLTVFAATSVAILAWIARRYDWLAARRTTLAYLPILPFIALLYYINFGHVFAGFGAVAWLAAIVAHFGLLYAYDDGRGKIEGVWHSAGVVMIVTVSAQELHWRVAQASLSALWSASAAMFTAALVAIMIVYARQKVAWPLQRYWSAYLAAAGAIISVTLLALIAGGIDSPGDPSPLPYVPILNPLDVLTIIGLLVALRIIVTANATSTRFAVLDVKYALGAWSVAALILTTIAVTRGVHHFTDVSWSDRALANSSYVQSALSIYWGMLGFAGMVWGARNARRWVWVAGTAMMALVVLKLFLVDLGNTGTVARIVSFLGVGALLLVVGYFAPAPPKHANARAEQSE